MPRIVLLALTAALPDVNLARMDAKLTQCFAQALAAVLQQVAGEGVVSAENRVKFAIFHFELNLNAAQIGGAQCKFHFPFAIAQLFVHASSHFGGHFVAELVIHLTHVQATGCGGVRGCVMGRVLGVGQCLCKAAHRGVFAL